MFGHGQRLTVLLFGCKTRHKRVPMQFLQRMGCTERFDISLKRMFGACLSLRANAKSDVACLNVKGKRYCGEDTSHVKIFKCNVSALGYRI